MLRLVSCSFNHRFWNTVLPPKRCSLQMIRGSWYATYDLFHRSQGASTLYGPHTLSGYIQEFSKLAEALVQGTSVKPSPPPPDMLQKQLSLLPPVILDTTPIGVKFGDVSSDIPQNSTFKKGDKVTVVFWSACPRNDLMTEGTFALIEILKGNNTWESAYDDDDFSLRFIWSRPAKLSPQSHATLEWRIPETAASAVYRITHFGAAKGVLGSIEHFTGSSRAFAVAWDYLIERDICAPKTLTTFQFVTYSINYINSSLHIVLDFFYHTLDKLSM